jgi:serine/threonine protein kinase
MAERIGQQIGNYRLISLLGSGGFAEVYLGEHIYLKTQAAIKLLQTRLSSADDMENFLKEAQTVARLLHPNIIRILDFGVAAQTPFLVMDYAQGGTLRLCHKRGERLPSETVVQYVRQVAEALQHAHAEKLIHRDVKPENMLVGRHNEILLSDFGIALVAQSSRYQSTQDVVGTIAYMAPEQIQGRPRPQSDQYALTIVVYEWLSGQRPFSGSFTELCAQHLYAPVPPLREKVPALAPEVEQVVTTALAKDPKERFGSVRAFAVALEQAYGLPNAAQVPIIHSAPTRLPESAPTQLGSPTAAALQTPPLQTPPALHVESISVSSPTSETSPGRIGWQQIMTVVKGDGWKIGRRQIIALIAGALICTGLEGIYAWQYLYWLSVLPLEMLAPSNFMIYPMGNVSFLPSLANILSSLVLAVPLFYSARYGPWTGMVVMLVEANFGGNIYSYLWYHYFLPPGAIVSPSFSFTLDPWYGLVEEALVGWIAGLVFLRTKGDYSIRGAWLPALIFAAFVTLCHSVFKTIFGTRLPLAPSFFDTLSNYIVSDIFVLLLFLLLLWLSARLSRHRSNAAW